MTIPFIKIFLFVSLLSSCLFSQSLNSYLNKGDDYYKKFDLINAAKNYEYAYEQNPRNYTVLEKLTKTFNDLGENYMELKETKKAEAAITDAVRYSEIFYALFSDSAKAYTMLAMSYGNLALFKGGNEKIKLAEKIRENAEKSIELNPNDYLPYIIMGIYNRQIASLSWFERAFANTFWGEIPEGSLSAAEQFLLKALKIQPGMITAMFNLSLVYKEMDDEHNEVYWLKQIVDAPISDFRDKYSKRKAKDRLNQLLN
jgi:tetratricopeptide (TPR) repeat protein